MKSYFEGWYFKHQNNDKAVAFIPSFHRDAQGQVSAMLQVITEQAACFAAYPASACAKSKNTFGIRIGNNYFSEKGILLNLHLKDMVIDGRLNYGPLQPLSYDIMGPFSMLPHMQCRHGVLSMAHRLYGSLKINGEELSFDGGTGYLEKDSGCSFPKFYLWSQCCWFDGGDCSLMVSAADIPYAGRCFTGCICAILYHGRQYRLATYLGVKILRMTEQELLLRQGRYRLHVRLVKASPQDLKAPVGGCMNRIIRESLSCTVHYRFWDGENLIFDVTSTQAGFEYGAPE